MKSTPAVPTDAEGSTRERLLAAAIVEFADHGYEDATVRAICRRAQVNVNAVKYYYTDKQGLYRAALREAHRARTAGMGPPAIPPELPAEEKLRQFVTIMLNRALAEDHEVLTPERRLLHRELEQPSGALDEVVRDFAGAIFSLLDSILTELLPSQVSSFDRWLLADSVMGECMHHRISQRIMKLMMTPDEFAQYTPERLVDHIVRVILAAARSYA